MNNQQFCESFMFNEFHRRQNFHTNNLSGIRINFLAKMKQGRVHLCSDEADFFAEPGEWFFIPTGCRYESFWFGEPEIVFDSLGFTFFPADTRILRLQKVVPDEKTRSLYAYLEENKTVDPHAVALLYEVMARLLPTMQSKAPDQHILFAEKAVGYMKAHRDFSVAEVAAYCKMSQSAFYAAFKQAAGVTPIQMKHRLIAEEAVSLLQATDYSVEALCAMLGISSPAYFRKILRQVYGTTPGEVRRLSL